MQMMTVMMMMHFFVKKIISYSEILNSVCR